MTTPSNKIGGEILLWAMQVCNLTEVVVRPHDTFEDLKHKVEIATIIGTMQASLTDFKYLNPKWKENTERDALLGVSLTGVMDHPIMSGRTTVCADMEGFVGDDEEKWTWPLSKVLSELREHSIEVNKKWAQVFGVNPSAMITTGKPSGTVSQRVDCSSGMHARFDDYYIRTVRADVKDPLAQAMMAAGFPNEPCVMKPESTVVFSFPLKSPKESVKVKDISAIQQLDHWLVYKRYWTEHNPSITIYYKEDELLDVAAWVYKNFDDIGGISFLPKDDHVYAQAPYQAISEAEYYEWMDRMPKGVDLAEILIEYEKEDATTGTQEYACTSGTCELVDIVGEGNK